MLEYVGIAGGSSGGAQFFDNQGLAESWMYIGGAVVVMFLAMAAFIRWNSR